VRRPRRALAAAGLLLLLLAVAVAVLVGRGDDDARSGAPEGTPARGAATTTDAAPATPGAAGPGSATKRDGADRPGAGAGGAAGDAAGSGGTRVAPLRPDEAGDPALVPPPPTAPGTAYVALGDSLAQGIQNIDGRLRTTNQGYPDALAARLRAAGTPVSLGRVGCSGATVRSLVEGARDCLPPPPRPLAYANRDPGTSQLAWAEDWLRRRGDRPTLLTIDIGANDLLGCFTPNVSRVRACFDERLPAVEARLRDVARRLRAAAGPRTVLAAMTYYDPAVALVRIGATRDAAVAFHDAVRRRANPAIVEVYEAEGFAVARVDRVFRSHRPATADGVVERTCDLTRLCTLADFHPTAEGYALIGDAFARVVRGRVARVTG
jgi:lysophospholipase L1-like esterase